MHRKTSIILRVLAVLTALVALGGFFFVGLAVPGFFTASSAFSSELPLFNQVYLGLILVNLTFVALLFVSAFLLWKLQRRGLFLLVLTLCLELLYMSILVGSTMVLEQNGLQMAIASLTGVGMMVLGLQIYTAYPLFALVLLILAYRHLGIPARAPEQDR
jgi:hypothetical protein